VLPTPHHDGEIGFWNWHAHLDWRFLLDSEIRLMGGYRPEIIQPLEGATLVMDNRICRREARIPNDWLASFIGNASKNAEALQDSAANQRAIQCGVCPHKGHRFDKSSVRQGVLHCPLHGLKFDTATGRHIPIPQPTEIPCSP